MTEEKMITRVDDMREFYKGKRVLVTGHTGFKGSWLSYWLADMGAKVMGVGEYPHTEPNHYDLLGLVSRIESLIDDARDTIIIQEYKPEIVFHLAANAVVADCFDDPAETFSNNIMAAVNVLDACDRTDSVKAVVMVTTDKVYESEEWEWAYRENDKLKGGDPYSVSKVCIEHIARWYQEGECGPRIAVARAGNVIGGGDWNKGRLLPDIMNAVSKGEVITIHTPKATRPWQHVLDPLYGYLELGKLMYEDSYDCDTAFNFGPTEEMRVVDILDQVGRSLGRKVAWTFSNHDTHPNMVYRLKIDSSRAKEILCWETVLGMREAIDWTAKWYDEYYRTGKLRTMDDIKAYEERRRKYEL